MTGQKGTIVAIREELGGRKALVEIDTSVACARCARGAGCGAGLASTGRKKHEVEVPLPRDQRHRVGDSVDLELEDRKLLAAAGLVYGFPLAGAAIGALLSYLAGYGDAAAALGVLCGLAAGLMIAKRMLRRSACLFEFTPRIVR